MTAKLLRCWLGSRMLIWMELNKNLIHIAFDIRTVFFIVVVVSLLYSRFVVAQMNGQQFSRMSWIEKKINWVLNLFTFWSIGRPFEQSIQIQFAELFWRVEKKKLYTIWSFRNENNHEIAKKRPIRWRSIMMFDEWTSIFPRIFLFSLMTLI